MNILLTCSGRRNYLVDYFRSSLGSRGKVYTLNSTLDAVSMVVSDGAVSAPPLYDHGYIDFLLNVCKKLDIGLLVPLFDLELPLLAKNRGRFAEAGVSVAVSDSKVISICADKLESDRFLKGIGLNTLYTTDDLAEAVRMMKKRDSQTPFYIKPRWGMGSLALQKALTTSELHVLSGKVKRTILNSPIKHHEPFDADRCVIYQEEASGDEYGLDVINDFNGNYKATLVKRKLEMHFGETQIGVTARIPELQQMGEAIGKELGHKGVLDVDLFWNGSRAYVLELNARFGGGYPFSHMAGADLPAAYVCWAENADAPNDYLTVNDGIKGFKGFSMIDGNSIQPVII
jgi:carbamoyl-phosphate synthase large subunit